jgi:hypothetical protein
MLFPDLLLRAIQSSEIPLRFEPGAEESVAKPVLDLLRVWLDAHQPADESSEFAAGQRTLLMQLVGELEGAIEVPQ